MAEQSWTEVPVFIHGITPSETPGSHQGEYGTLRRLIDEALIQSGKEPFSKPSIEVEWGYGLDEYQEDEPHLHRYLGTCERLVATQVMQTTEGVWDWTLNPTRLLSDVIRRMMLLGFADIFYYISMDGEASIREHIFTELSRQIAEREAQMPQEEKISLTFIGHSAGSVIAHDLLYHLFRTEESPVAMVNQVRDLVQNGQIRVRRFYTLGSPITPLLFRANSLLIKTLKEEKLDLENMGLRQSDGLSNPRWVNFWDRDDVIACPLEFLYQSAGSEKVVEDKYVDLGDYFPTVHSMYWASREVAEYIAQTF